MLLKLTIVFVFLLLVVSLFSGLAFLFKDQGNSKRTLYSLGTRLVLAAILMSLIGYGMMTGQLRSSAPWSAHNQALQAEAAKQLAPPASLENVNK